MKRSLLAFLLLLTAASTFGDEVVRCESKGGRRRCTFETPGSVSVEVKRQLSITECAEGTNWGFRNGEIWVDGGCRADFLVRRHYDRRPSEGDGQSITCESNGRRRRCDVRVPGDVRLQRQFGRAECVLNETWGYDRDGIWVDRGCRADFFVPARRDDYGRDEHDRSNDRDRRRSETIVCESRNGNTEICEIDTRRGVELSRQLSGAECVFRRTWGYNDRGVWVKDGCRAEFVVGTH